MGRTAKGRRLEHSGQFMPGVKFIDQSETERAEQVAADWNRAAQDRPDLDRAMQKQYSGQPHPDDEPPSTEKDEPAGQTSRGRLKAGTPEAREHMAKLRSMRGKAKPSTDTETNDNDD